MPKLPQLTGRVVVAALQRHGFTIDRVHGSHHILRKVGHRFTVSVPVHAGKNVNPFTLKNILRQAGLTEQEFLTSL
jgi:predicted RNA binding protein YcfA (HicA-like mRNA interferase family)